METIGGPKDLKSYAPQGIETGGRARYPTGTDKGQELTHYFASLLSIILIKLIP